MSAPGGAGRSVGGHYLLLLWLPADAPLRIGARPAVPFAAGWHVYVGSAQGSGGLAARLARHGRSAKRHHWHIDWLLDVAELAAVWARPGGIGRECGWVTGLLARGGRRAPPGFGSGDCRCAGHLVWFADRPDLATLPDVAGTAAFQPWTG